MRQPLSFIIAILTITVFGQPKQVENLSAFLPKGYVVFEKIYGDLNKDNLKDCILIIKATDKTKIVIDEYEHKVDKNRRGIIILFNEKGKYQLAVKNYKCFSSENEDGGVYMPPDLSVEISKEKLYVHYGHGRYGYWRYIFEFKNSDFELIGYDSSSNYGPIVNTETSINFLTKRKLIKENINESDNQESGDEIFKETWSDIKLYKRVKLSVVKDFDELDSSFYRL